MIRNPNAGPLDLGEEHFKKIALYCKKYQVDHPDLAWDMAMLHERKCDKSSADCTCNPFFFQPNIVA